MTTIEAPRTATAGCGYPIDTAPIAGRERFEPCLIWLPERGEWCIGGWGAENRGGLGSWFDDGGGLVEPTAWAPLPAKPGGDPFALGGRQTAGPDTPILNAAREIARLNTLSEELELAEQKADADEHFADKAKLRRRRDAIGTRKWALEMLIGTTAANSAAEAAVQVALAAGMVDRSLAAEEEEAPYLEDMKAVDRMLGSVLRALIRDAGVDPEEFAISYYCGPSVDYWRQEGEGAAA